MKLLDIEIKMALDAGDGRAAVRSLLNHFGVLESELSYAEIRWWKASNPTGCNLTVDWGPDTYVWHTGVTAHWRTLGEKTKTANIWWTNEVR